MFFPLCVTPNDGDDTSLRGFLAVFDLAQILKLVLISIKTQYVGSGFLVVYSRTLP